VPVNVGIRGERTIQILSGIQAGDTVITSGLLQVRDGSPISVTVIQKEKVSAESAERR
jgi:membrane fusion protein, multidrug efflux system